MRVAVFSVKNVGLLELTVGVYLVILSKAIIIILFTHYKSNGTFSYFVIYKKVLKSINANDFNYKFYMVTR